MQRVGGPRLADFERLIARALADPVDPDVATDLERYRSGGISRRKLAETVAREVVEPVHYPTLPGHAPIGGSGGVDEALGNVLRRLSPRGE